MNDYFVILGKTIPIVVIICMGVVFRQLKLFQAEADSTVMKLFINLFYPCLIFVNIFGNEALQSLSNLAMAPLIGVVCLSVGFIISYYWIGTRNMDRAQRRSFAFTTGVFNYGYIPIPLSQIIFAPATTGVLMVYNLGVELTFWSLGLFLLTGMAGSSSWRRLLNPPVLTILIAVSLNLIGLPGFLKDPGFSFSFLNHVILMGTDIMLTTMRMCSHCAIPLALVFIGASICDLWKATPWWRGLAIPMHGVLLRLGIIPVLFLLMARWLPIEEPLREVLILQAAMPAGMFSVVMIRMFGGDVKTSLQIIMSTSLLSLITIPLWIQLGLWWIHW
jgi:predicted permease